MRALLKVHICHTGPCTQESYVRTILTDNRGVPGGDYLQTVYTGVYTRRGTYPTIPRVAYTRLYLSPKALS